MSDKIDLELKRLLADWQREADETEGARIEAGAAWLRQPKESEKTFEYFSYFLSLPPAERSNRRVSEEYTVSEQNIKQIRRRWKWNERALEYDNHLSSAATRAMTKAVEKAEFNWAAWEIANLEKTRRITDELFNKVEEILKLEVVQFRADDAIRFIESAVILTNYLMERQRSLFTKFDFNQILPELLKPLEDMTEDELSEYIEKCQKASRKLYEN
jgi:hypothetical protein